jgi:beta-glucosidase
LIIGAGQRAGQGGSPKSGGGRSGLGVDAFEVAQVYLGQPAVAGEPPKRLVGWARMQLEPGEGRRLSVTLDPQFPEQPLSYWNITVSGWMIAPGGDRVHVGASWREIHPSDVRLC